MYNWSDLQKLSTQKYNANILPLVAPANQVVSEQMNFLRNFQAGQAQGNNFNNGAGVPADQAAYMQYLQQQMFAQQQQLQQLGAWASQYGPGIRNGGGGGGNNNAQLVALLQLLDSFKSGGGSSGGSTSSGPAEAALLKALKKSSRDDDAPDTDDDNNVVSEGDLDYLKDLMDDDKFSKGELEFAFYNLLVKGPSRVAIGKADELFDLLGHAIDSKLVSADMFLSPSFIEGLTTQRREMFTSELAGIGLANDEGKVNRKMYTFLLNNLDNEDSEKTEDFARATLTEMIKEYMDPDISNDQPDKKQLLLLLKSLEFEFEANGTTLKPGDDQPYGIEVPTFADVAD